MVSSSGTILNQFVAGKTWSDIATPHKNEPGNQNRKAKPSPVCKYFSMLCAWQIALMRVYILSVIVDGFGSHQLMVKLPYTPLGQPRSTMRGPFHRPLLHKCFLILMSVAACKLAAPLLSLSTRHAQYAQNSPCGRHMRNESSHASFVNRPSKRAKLLAFQKVFRNSISASFSSFLSPVSPGKKSVPK